MTIPELTKKIEALESSNAQLADKVVKLETAFATVKTDSEAAIVKATEAATGKTAESAESLAKQTENTKKLTETVQSLEATNKALNERLIKIEASAKAAPVEADTEQMDRGQLMQAYEKIEDPWKRADFYEKNKNKMGAS